MRSRWAWQVGVLFGIPIRVHATFVLLLLWFGWVSAEQGAGFGTGVVFLLLLFGCVALHELGHALAALRYGIRTREIVLYPIGGIARLQRMPAGQPELWIAAAGPAVNLVLSVLLGAAALSLGGGADLGAGLAADTLLVYLVLANLALFAFNLIPAFPMDGGRILRALLSLFLPLGQATQVATRVGQALAVAFGLVGLALGNFLLVLIALFVFLGATQEASLYRRQRLLAGRPAREAMIRRFERLSPQQTLGEAATLWLRSHQSEFPVVDAWGRITGLLGHGQLLEGLRLHGPEAALLEVIEREVPVVRPDTDLAEVLARLDGVPPRAVMVADEDGLVGLITGESIARLVQVVARLRRVARRPAAAGSD